MCYGLRQSREGNVAGILQESPPRQRVGGISPTAPFPSVVTARKRKADASVPGRPGVKRKLAHNVSGSQPPVQGSSSKKVALGAFLRQLTMLVGRQSGATPPEVSS